MATNRRDVLDRALLRAGRFDRQIEIPLPNNHSRMQILQIYAAEIAKQGEIDYEAVVKLSEVYINDTYACMPIESIILDSFSNCFV